MFPNRFVIGALICAAVTPDYSSADQPPHRSKTTKHTGNHQRSHASGHDHPPAGTIDNFRQEPDRNLWKHGVEQGESLDLFSKRILPLLQAESSSCTECHFAGVDLKNYIQPDQAQTFASLRDRGLIDVRHPDESKILTFIARTPAHANPLQSQVRQHEFQAFRVWIHAAVKDPGLLKSKTDRPLPGTELPLEVIRHARKDRVLSSFIENIWSQTGRCSGCHSPDRNQRVVEKHGAQVSWIVPGNPAATLEALVEAGDIDLDSPDESPLLTKPAGLAEHGGGPKFLVGDPAYRGFLRFLTDYAAVTGNKYRKADDLPQPPDEIILLGQQHLRLTGLPERFGDLPLKVDLYRWDRERRQWSKDRWATALNPVNAKNRQWQCMINVAAPRDSQRAAEIRQESLLPPGAYLAKVYVDRDRKIAKDPNYELGEREFVGQVEITGHWPPGYQPPKIVDAAEFLKL